MTKKAHELTDADYAEAVQEARAALAPKAAGPDGAPAPACDCPDHKIEQFLRVAVEHEAAGAKAGFDWKAALKKALELLVKVAPIIFSDAPAPAAE